jgi:hypothetical protein
VTKYLKKQLKKSNNLLWLVVSVHSYSAPLFLGHGEAEHRGREQAVKRSCWPYGGLKGEREIGRAQGQDVLFKEKLPVLDFLQPYPTS